MCVLQAALIIHEDIVKSTMKAETQQQPDIAIPEKERTKQLDMSLD